MEQVICPGCGLQMNVNAFKNCPNCHTLVEAAPPAPATEPAPEPPAGDGTETEQEASQATEPGQPA